ncbi:hypothetical protein ABIF65_003775 [Bradyrhizobium japonicum]|uniref:hypothetical protein n=1 Tax=Bradyrhizobium TaxID=374 RepID=UPI0004B56A2A|nr:MULTISPECIES: hypothetical protein [Bradyrhizobium]MBR0998743.1 hypothetical protein [Bradyrhizobium liaoningense]MBR1030023.1 hypothetical protein [Bradyrhizobium liaoningense]
MALRWRGLIAVLECDSCNAEIESDRGETFDEFTERRKKAGWTASRVGRGQDYTHGCPKHGA